MRKIISIMLIVLAVLLCVVPSKPIISKSSVDFLNEEYEEYKRKFETEAVMGGFTIDGAIYYNGYIFNTSKWSLPSEIEDDSKRAGRTHECDDAYFRLIGSDNTYTEGQLYVVWDTDSDGKRFTFQIKDNEGNVYTYIPVSSDKKNMLLVILQYYRYVLAGLMLIAAGFLTVYEIRRGKWKKINCRLAAAVVCILLIVAAIVLCIHAPVGIISNSQEMAVYDAGEKRNADLQHNQEAREDGNFSDVIGDIPDINHKLSYKGYLFAGSTEIDNQLDENAVYVTKTYENTEIENKAFKSENTFAGGEIYIVDNKTDSDYFYFQIKEDDQIVSFYPYEIERKNTLFVILQYYRYILAGLMLIAAGFMVVYEIRSGKWKKIK